MNLSERDVATIRAALEVWKEELQEGSEWISDSLFFQKSAPLSLAEVSELANRLTRIDAKNSRNRVHQAQDDVGQWRLKLRVPTYYGAQTPKSQSAARPDLGRPLVPVLVSESAGVRLLLGSHQLEDRVKPDVQIERRPHGWALFLHPDAGDPIGCLYFLDDGRSYLVVERFPSSSLQIVDDAPPELDAP